MSECTPISLGVIGHSEDFLFQEWGEDLTSEAREGGQNLALIPLSQTVLKASADFFFLTEAPTSEKRKMRDIGDHARLRKTLDRWNPKISYSSIITTTPQHRNIYTNPNLGLNNFSPITCKEGKQ